MSQVWNKKEYQLLSKQVHLWGCLLIKRKKGLHIGLCASVLALAVWQVAQYLLQLQNPKFLCFVSLRPVWGRYWYDFLFSGPQTSIISFDLLDIHVP